MSAARDPLPTRADLEAVFEQKYGSLEETGWGPRMRRRFDYFTPDDHYEVVVRQLIEHGTTWLDVGCGRNLFPSNQALARELSARCALLVGVDPDETLSENPYVHEKVIGSIDAFESERRFDVVTMRMVAEHVRDPEQVARRLAACARPGGAVVVYTVNRYSPIPLLTTVVPLALRHPIKKFLWRTESKDTFPTFFRMNSRRRLAVFELNDAVVEDRCGVDDSVDLSEVLPGRRNRGFHLRRVGHVTLDGENRRAELLHGLDFTYRLTDPVVTITRLGALRPFTTRRKWRASDENESRPDRSCQKCCQLESNSSQTPRDEVGALRLQTGFIAARFRQPDGLESLNPPAVTTVCDDRIPRRVHRLRDEPTDQIASLRTRRIRKNDVDAATPDGRVFAGNDPRQTQHGRLLRVDGFVT